MKLVCLKCKAGLVPFSSVSMLLVRSSDLEPALFSCSAFSCSACSCSILISEDAPLAVGPDAEEMGGAFEAAGGHLVIVEK